MKFYILIILVSIGLFSCSEVKKEVVSSKPFTLSEKQLKGMNISLTATQKITIQPMVVSTGKVSMAPNSSAIISTNIRGKISEILVREGTYVTKGQPLLRISSIEFIELQQSYLSAKNEAQLLTLEFERQKKLREDNIGALADFQAVESKYYNALNTVESIGEKLKLLGVDVTEYNHKSTANVKNTLTITSPISGSVFKIKSTLGMFVDPTTDLVEVYNLEKLYVDLDIYEKDIDLVQIGQDVTIEFLNQNVPKVKGKVTFVLNAIDPMAKAIPVHASFIPPKGSNILPDMGVKALLVGKASTTPVIAVPNAALLQEGELFFVFIAMPKENATYQFKKVKVILGDSDGVWTEVKVGEGIDKGTLVVSENVYLINAERKKMESN
ncbi:MAG: efflux RND transporter periplasmic adaptor subunit [Cytophagaceae bacterium]|jgi:cobalt-zinc-cadmium efflux system membrane fusion protein|nr:efflux RND transporter periplasmic adaptor subunit [Cytophagaceae bacterium]